MKLVLEQRYLFDGSAVATGHHAFGGDHHHHHQHDGAVAWVDPHHGQQTGLPAPPAIAEPRGALSGSPETVLFVDPRVANWQSLVSGVKSNVEVVVLDPNANGIAQVTQALSNLTNVKNIEFLTDGTPGSITLGGTTLDTATLTANASAITAWSSHLAHNADIVFWGCDVGQGSVGAGFVADVHTLTGATVGASSDATGAASLGGDWTLEVATGPLHRDVNPFTKATLASYTGVLDTPDPIVALSVTDNGVTDAGTLNLGDTLTVTVNLENGAQAATGDTPYVELFAPGQVTLSGSVTENGAALTDIAVTVSNGSFVNPLTHQTEAAPTGFTNGTMYLVELPGPLAAGAVAPLVASFVMPNDTSLVGQNLTIGARGGFADGSVLGSGNNIEGDTYTSTAQVIQPLDPSIAVVGASDQATTAFDPTGTTSGTSVTTLPGEILMMRATDQLSIGANNNVTLTVTLANGLTLDPNYLTDGSVTVLLVSGGGNATTSTTLSTNTGALQLAEGSTAFDPTQKLGTGADTSDPVVASLSTSAISVSGQVITLNLGNITTSGSEPAYVVVEMPVVVGTAVTGNTTLSAAPSNTATTATQTVSTGYLTTDLSNVLMTLPLFNSQLGTLTHVALSLTGNVTTNGTFTDEDSGVSASVSYSVTPHLTLSSVSGGPTLPSNFVVRPSASETYTNVSPNQVVAFNPSPGESQADPATATQSKAVTTNLTTYETGTSNGEVQVNSVTSFSSTGGGGNFQQSLVTTAEADLSVTYTYTTNTVAATSYVTVETPTVTLAKQVEAITYSGTTATVTIVDTVTNTGPVALHGVNVTDPGVGTGTVNDPHTYAGNGTTPGSSVVGTSYDTTLASLPSGGSETYTYTVTVPSSDISAAVTGSLASATVTSTALNPAYFNGSNLEHLTTATSTPPTYTAAAAAPLDSIAGTVNHDTAVTKGTDSPLVPLSNETVTVSYTGQTSTESVQTDSSGNFDVLVPDGLSSVSIKAAVGGALAGAVLDNDPTTGTTPALVSPSVSGTNPATLTFAPTAGTSYSGLTFDFWQASTSTLTPTLTIVGESNNSGGNGTVVDPASGNTVLFDPIASDTTTDGAIVRERATLAFTAGSATATSMTVTLPTNLTFDPNYATDNSVTVLLVDTSGTTTTTLPGTQLTPGTLNTAKLDLGSGADTTDPVTTVLPSSDVSISGSKVTFTLGDLANTSGTYYAVVEFNALVNAAAPSGTGLTSSMTGTANSTTVGPVTDVVTPQAPTVTLAKAITGITYTGTTATVTYVDTLTNTSTTAPAYELTLTDTGDGNSADTLAYVSDSGGGVVTSAGVVGGNLKATLTSLAANTTETFTYTETVPLADVPTSVTDSQTAPATVTSSALNPALFNAGNEALAHTVVTPSLATKTAVAPFDSVAGTVNQDTAAIKGTDTPLVPLSNETVTVSYTGQTVTESLQTDGSGNFVALAPDGVSSVSIKAAVGGALSGAVLDNDPTKGTTPALVSPSVSGTNPATLTFAPTAGTSYSGLTFDFWQASPSTLTPTLTIVGESNNTGGNGTVVDPASGNTVLFDPIASDTTTDGAIVRERATLAFTPGVANGTTMTVTLPSNLTFDPNYATDNSVTVLLVDTSGTTTTTLPGTQLTPGTLNTAKLDLGSGADTTDPVTTTLPSSDVSVSGSAVTFTLGNLANTSGTYYAVVEFNALVNTAAPNGAGLTSSMTGTANSVTVGPVTDVVTPQAPTVTLAKAITGITYSGTTATVTYVDTLTNTSTTAPAYGLTLTDTGDGNSADTLAYVSDSGGGVVTSVGVVAGNLKATLTSLAANTTETFTYTETVPLADVAASVVDSKTAPATVTSHALNPALFSDNTEALARTVVTPALATATKLAPFDSISGTVNHDTGGTEGSDNPLVPIPNQTVTVTYPGGTETVTTDSNGGFNVLVPVTGPVTITTGTGGTNLSTAVLDNHPETAASLAGTNPSTSGFQSTSASLTFTPAAGTSYPGVTFDFWQPTATPTVTPLPNPEPLPPEFVGNAQQDPLLAWYGEPLINDLGLIGSPFNYFIITDVRSVIEVPQGIFVDSDPDANLTFEATGEGGTPLPDWLSFNANNLTFYGVAPDDAVGPHEITITATDQVGNQAKATFTIRVGHPAADLLKLLQETGDQAGQGLVPQGFHLGALAPAAAPAGERPIYLADAAPAVPHSTPHRDVPVWDGVARDGNFVHATTVASRSADFGGFTGALRKAGQMGALARARALLDGLQAMGQEPNPG